MSQGDEVIRADDIYILHFSHTPKLLNKEHQPDILCEIAPEGVKTLFYKEIPKITA